jgi:hypothetical protein
MSEKTASNIGILRISANKRCHVIAYKHTEDLNVLYNKNSLYLRWIAGLSE